MAYKLFSPNGVEIKLPDLQDKGPWCKTGATFEDVFIAKYGSSLSLIINPAKANDPYVPDLLNLETNFFADLKTQNTPFFQARDRYQLNPQYAVTFNEKDWKRYSTKYPGIDIFFWVSWLVTKFDGSTKVEVKPMEGIWYISYASLEKLVAKAPLHTYIQRIGDTKGNAKGSFVFNLEDPLIKKIL